MMPVLELTQDKWGSLWGIMCESYWDLCLPACDTCFVLTSY